MRKTMMNWNPIQTGARRYLAPTVALVLAVSACSAVADTTVSFQQGVAG
jgi:hypothetical protein